MVHLAVNLLHTIHVTHVNQSIDLLLLRQNHAANLSLGKPLMCGKKVIPDNKDAE